jgi:hypothetical protein
VQDRTVGQPEDGIAGTHGRLLGSYLGRMSRLLDEDRCEGGIGGTHGCLLRGHFGCMSVLSGEDGIGGTGSRFLRSHIGCVFLGFRGTERLTSGRECAQAQ